MSLAISFRMWNFVGRSFSNKNHFKHRAILFGKACAPIFGVVAAVVTIYLHPVHHWKQAMNWFSIEFSERLTKSEQ